MPEPTKRQLQEAMADQSEKLSIREMELGQAGNNLELLEERLAELELALEDTGWIRQSFLLEREFSRDGLRRIIRLARLSYLKNPLINHAAQVGANYVWAQGAQIGAESEVVNDVIQKCMADRRNSKVLFGHQARIEREVQMQIEGNLFLALFTNRSTGWVNFRAVNVEEILEIISDPDDAQSPWYYHRVWAERKFDADTGAFQIDSREGYYPDLSYRPKAKPKTVNSYPVFWDSPMYHARRGGFADMQFGVPEVYSALDWARAVKEDLEDYATIRRALSRFAFKMTAKGGRGAVAAAKSKLSTTVGNNAGTQIESNPPPVRGSTFVGSPGVDMEPMKVTGATISPKESDNLWLMVAAGVGIPKTILAGDADSGNLATAKTLDRPTELQMRQIQGYWADMLIDLLGYVVDQAAKATKGPLPGTEEVDPYSEQPSMVLGMGDDGEEIDRTIAVSFPGILERAVLERIQAVVQGATLSTGNGTLAGTMDLKTASRLILSALGVEEIDETLAEMFPDNWEAQQARIGLPPELAADISVPGPGAAPKDNQLAEAREGLREAIVKVFGDVLPLQLRAAQAVLPLGEPRTA